jgi:hypothetical protein
VNENDLREAMHTTLATLPEPPPMDVTATLAAGRRAVRRRSALAVGGSAAAVLALGVLIAGPGQHWFTGGGTWDATAAGQPSAPAPPAHDQRSPEPTATPAAPGDKTAPSWPTEAPGKPQQDATARSGPRYKQGERLLEELLTVVPDGWATPTGTAADGIPLRDHQAAVEDKAWGYLASAAVAKDGGTGRLLAEVYTKGNGLPAEPCALARSFWRLGGTCEVVTVHGTRVGVVVEPGADDRLDQWAAFRHPDGIVVYVAQSRMATNGDPAMPALRELPLSVRELAAAATDQRFHLE